MLHITVTKIIYIYIYIFQFDHSFMYDIDDYGIVDSYSNSTYKSLI